MPVNEDLIDLASAGDKNAINLIMKCRYLKFFLSHKHSNCWNIELNA